MFRSSRLPVCCTSLVNCVATAWLSFSHPPLAPSQSLQINHMKKFIRQEAHEKAEEIMIKVGIIRMTERWVHHHQPLFAFKLLIIFACFGVEQYCVLPEGDSGARFECSISHHRGCGSEWGVCVGERC